MRNLLLLAGAGMMLALGAPADAKPGKGHSAAAKVHTNAKGYIDMNRNGIADWRERSLIDANGNGILDYRERQRVDINRNGIPDWREAWIDRNRNRIDDRQEAMMRQYGGAVCPPGLAKKTPACVPPGQAGRAGPLPTGYRMVSWNTIPVSVRDRYDLDDDWRYAYYGHRLYVIDPATDLITRIITGVVF
jgi:hypothetical protein